MSVRILSTGSLAALLAAALAGAPAQAQSILAYAPQAQAPQVEAQQPYQIQEVAPVDEALPADPRLQRQMVAYQTSEKPGTLIVDTPNTYLYYVLGNGQAIRYGIGVGREGFTWAGVKQVARKAEWPDWYPPQEMIERQPYLPRMTAGGPGNPLGARAMYIGGTVYRIHGTNDPTTIGKNVSSGCIRLTNEDVIDLYQRVQVGAKVVVLPQTHTASKATPQRVAEQMPPASSSFAPPSNAQRAWAAITPATLY
jgi:lipoprotein-anchoring transpeptidase ErfK/SrfK